MRALPKRNLLCGLSFIVLDRLGLATVTGLLLIVSPLTYKRYITSPRTSRTLSPDTLLALLVLGDLVDGVLLALPGTVGFPLLWDIDLANEKIFFGELYHFTKDMLFNFS